MRPKRSGTSQRRLGEIQAAHGLLRRLFPRSTFEGPEMERALEFARNGVDSGVQAPAQVIRRLLNWYADGNPGVACRVVDAGALSGGPLWLQAALDRVVGGLRRGRPAVVFVTGLREAVRPGARRWSRSAERERDATLQLVEARVGQWARRTGTPVSLFVS